MCIVFGNMPHDIQSLEVYDSTFPTINPNIESQVNSQYLKILIQLSQTIRLRELDEYFTLFERVAEMARGVQAIVASDCVGWESSKCVCIFICCSNYKTVKEAILRAYELVPEAYRQQFGKLRKSESQTHVEFAREQQILFECWCKSQDIVYCFYIKCIQEVHYINSSMQPSLKPSQYSNDAVEIKVRKNDM